MRSPSTLAKSATSPVIPPTLQAPKVVQALTKVSQASSAPRAESEALSGAAESGNPPSLPPAVPHTDSHTGNIPASNPPLSSAVPPSSPSELLQDQPRPVRNRLRQPRILPKAPVKHPDFGWKNTYNREKNDDRQKSFDLMRLLDVESESLDKCCLVQWRGRPLQMSWDWEEGLQDYPEMMERVDEWKSAGTDETFIQYFRRVYSGATASAGGLCFLDLLRMACHHLGQPSLITLDFWDEFEESHPRDMQHGVRRADAVKFFKFLQCKRISLNYTELWPNRLDDSFAITKSFVKFVKTLDPGLCITCAASHDVQHCVVVVVSPGKLVEVLDDFDEDDDPCYETKVLMGQRCITGVRYMARFQLSPEFTGRHGKRKSKAQKKWDRKKKKTSQL